MILRFTSWLASYLAIVFASYKEHIIINYSLSLLSEVTGSIGVQLKYLKGLPSGTARVEVSGHQQNGQVIITTLISCKNATLHNFKALHTYVKC